MKIDWWEVLIKFTKLFDKAELIRVINRQNELIELLDKISW